MSVMQERYLRWLRVESPFSIFLIVAITIAAFLPYSHYTMACVLFVGLLGRTMHCGIERGSPLANVVLLIPAWPAYVAVDGIRHWMRRMGFGPEFRMAVTGILFFLCWMPVFGTGIPMLTSAIGLAAVATVALREYVTGQWYLLPSLALTLIYTRMWT